MQEFQIPYRGEVIPWQTAAMLFRCGIRIEVCLVPDGKWYGISNPNYKFNWAVATRRYRVMEE
jgi:hypothetical protein